MSYASLMVHVDPGNEGEVRVTQACNLAERFDASVIEISASQPDALKVDAYTGGAMLGELLGLLSDQGRGRRQEV